MRKMSTMLVIASTVLFLSASISMLSCDRPSSVAPETGNSSEAIQAAQGNSAPALRRVPRKISVAKGITKNSPCAGTTESMWMTVADGGELSHCGHVLMVPPGALKQDTLMSISVMASDFIDVDFGPDGEFNRAVTIRLSYADANLKGIKENNLRIAWVDEKTGKLIEIKSEVHKDGKYVEGKTDHFTQYTLSTR